MPKIRENLLNLEVFQYATSVYLNMSYYFISLREQARNLRTIIPPSGEYRYKRLTMGVSTPQEIFQEKMNEMFSGFGFIQAHIYDMLIVTKGDWSNHLK